MKRWKRGGRNERTNNLAKLMERKKSCIEDDGEEENKRTRAGRGGKVKMKTIRRRHTVKQKHK